MTMYRARWIDGLGRVVRDETFEGFPEKHEQAGYVNRIGLITLTVDNSYFAAPDDWKHRLWRTPLNEHLQGYIEVVSVSESSYMLVNEEGALREGWSAQRDDFRQDLTPREQDAIAVVLAAFDRIGG